MIYRFLIRWASWFFPNSLGSTGFSLRQGNQWPIHWRNCRQISNSIAVFKCFVGLQEKSREQREAELIPKVKEAIQCGLAVVDTMFEEIRVDIGADSDSDDDVTQGESILRVKVSEGQTSKLLR